MKASVIVLSWNGMDYLGDCLDAVLSQDYPDFEVIVVDNGSTDGSADFVAAHYPGVGLIRNGRNLGFSAGNNVGLRASTGGILVLLNQDTVVQVGWLAALAEALDDPTVGIAGCRMYYPDGTIQHAGAYLYGTRGESEHLGRSERETGQYDQLGDVEFVTGACIALTQATLTRVGLLDEGFAPAYFEDVDWCYRARTTGLRVVYVPEANVVHYEFTSTDRLAHEHKFAWHQGRLRFLFKHRSLDWLRDEFAPDEIAWLRAMGRKKELMAVRGAYLSTILTLGGIVSFRGSSVDEADALVGLLTDLRTVAVEGLAALALTSSLTPAGCEPPPTPSRFQSFLPEVRQEGLLEVVGGAMSEDSGSAESLGGAGESPEGAPTEEDEQLALRMYRARTRVLDRLEATRTIPEFRFASRIPVVGGLIVALRQAVLSVATKWYVRPLIRQQSEFNLQVVKYVRLLQDYIAYVEHEQDYHGLLLGWLSRRADRLDGQFAECGQLLQGQMRDVAQNIREITRLSEQLAKAEMPCDQEEE